MKMNKLEDQKIYLKDYRVPNYLVDQVELTFKLSEEKTRVLAKVFFRLTLKQQIANSISTE